MKPPYACGIQVETPLQESGKIQLGGGAELKIREAASLAKKVREFAGTQVKVRLGPSLRAKELSVAETDLQYRLEQLRTP